MSSYTKQTKNTFFVNDHHFITNGYQNVIFRDIVEIWKKLKNGRFFHEIFVKIHFKIGTMKY